MNEWISNPSCPLHKHNAKLFLKSEMRMQEQKRKLGCGSSDISAIRIIIGWRSWLQLHAWLGCSVSCFSVLKTQAAQKQLNFLHRVTSVLFCQLLWAARCPYQQQNLIWTNRVKLQLPGCWSWEASPLLRPYFLIRLIRQVGFNMKFLPGVLNYR